MVWDPLRKKDVALTPEEGVRQWFIGVLHSQCGIPLHMMRSEVAFDFGQEVGVIAGTSRKRYRADIVVYDRSVKPILSVECKRPEVAIDASVAEQAMRYNYVLNVRWLVLTNGKTTYVYKRNGQSFTPCPTIPSYEEMMAD